MNQFDIKMKEELKDDSHKIKVPSDGLILEDETLLATDEPQEQTQADHNGSTDKAYNAYLGAELLIPHGDTHTRKSSKWLEMMMGTLLGNATQTLCWTNDDMKFNLVMALYQNTLQI